MSRPLRSGGPFSYEGTVPGDKSISHRALLFGALAEGQTTIRNFLPGADPLSTLGALRALGVGIQTEGAVLTVTGRPQGLGEPTDILDCGNSGTTLRLLLGILSGEKFFSVLTGDASLRRRPMGRVVEPLRSMGAQVWGRGGDRLAPLAVRGQELQGGHRHHLTVASAQVKTALLLAGRSLPGRTEVTEPFRSRDHSERMLRAFGARVGEEDAPDGHRVWIEGGEPWQGLEIDVPGDFSSAAFLLAAGLAHPEGRVHLDRVGLNPTRLGLLEAWRAMGADVSWRVKGEEAGEPWGEVESRGSSLRGFTLGPEMVPRLIDEIPILAVTALWAEGETVIRGAEDLRTKESDRIAALASEFRALGAEVEELPDGLIIQGGRPLKGAKLHSHGDHRLAMALGIAALTAGGESQLEGAEDVGVSFPEFWSVLAEGLPR